MTSMLVHQIILGNMVKNLALSDSRVTPVHLWATSPALAILRCLFATSSRKHRQEPTKFPKVKLDPV